MYRLFREYKILPGDFWWLPEGEKHALLAFLQLEDEEREDH